MYLMELVRGTSLDRMLKAKGRLPLAQVIGLARQICKGLAHAHSVGVVHRDIKPENVMIDESRGRASVKIVDFGLAALLDGDDEVACAGTPAYMAPEQVRGEVVDARADLYSLGVMLYKLACGRAPFVADSEDELMIAQLEQQPTRPSTAVPEAKLPAAFDMLVLHCMAKAPEDRPAGAIELEAALIELQLELGLRTEVDDLPVPEVEPKRRARLERELARLRANRRRRGRGLVLALGFAASVAIGVYVESRAALEQATQRQVLVLDDRARAAASDQRWVYPPASAPEAETAYRVLLELEALPGELASSSGARLRGEFRDTLLELGDEFWDRAGGRSVAREFYAQALVFDPSEPRAQARAGLSRTALEGLRNDAATLGFESGELVAVAPLAALAADEPEVRAERLAALREEVDALPLSSAVQIERLVEEFGEPEVTPLASEARSLEPELSEALAMVTPPAELAPVEQAPVELPPVELPPVEQAPVEQGPVEQAPVETDTKVVTHEVDRKAAKQLVGQAEQAYASGKSSEAERLYHRALEQDRNSVAAIVGLYDLHFDRAEFRDALGYAKRALALQPKQGRHAIAVGDACMKVLDYPCARTHYELALARGDARASKRIELLDARTKP
jgi:hypothetical protein